MIHVIDNDPYVLAMLTNVLSVLGHTNQVFPCHIKYNSYATSDDYTTPCIIITGVKTQSQFMHKLAILHQNVKFIVMTNSHEITEGSNKFPHALIRKPFHPKELGNTIKQLLGNEYLLEKKAAA